MVSNKKLHIQNIEKFKYWRVYHNNNNTILNEWKTPQQTKIIKYFKTFHKKINININEIIKSNSIIHDESILIFQLYKPSENILPSFIC